MNANFHAHQQQGAASLLTALMLLVSITLVSLVTSKTVVVETKIAAENYRSSQAAAAASAAMDQAVAYFKAGGLDQMNNTSGALVADGLVDFIESVGYAEPTAASCSMPSTTASPITLTAGNQTTYALFYFDNSDNTDPLTDNACDCQSLTAQDIDGDGDGDCMGTLETNMTRATVVAKGWSDDCTAVRTVTQCVGTYDIFDNGGQSPEQPFVSRAGIGAFGNAKIINRYNNSTIWSGGPDTVHGASYGTYLRPSNTESADYTDAELDSPNENANTQLVSNRDSGNGIDVVTMDPTLSSKTSSLVNLTDPAQNQFFDMFFAQTKAEIKEAATTSSQMLPAGTDPNGKTGLIWIEGNTALHNTTVVGSATKPAILIVNGDLDMTGGTVYGVIYVTGDLKITGNPIVYGSIVGEKNNPSTGAGTLTMVYKPWGGSGVANQSPPFLVGTGTVIAGSWKDW